MRDCSCGQKRIAVLFLMFASLTLVLVALSFDRGVAVMMHYTAPMIFAFAGMTLFAGRYRRQIDLWVGVAFVGWYVLSRILMKELYLDYSYSMFANLCCAYLLAFPFARSMDDGQRKTGLKAAAAVFVVGFGLTAWIAVLGALLGEMITLPYLGTELGISAAYRRLWAGNHPNISACMFMVALLLGVWLIGQVRRRWLAAPVLVLCIGAYAGIALTVSRTVMLQVSCFAAGCVVLAALRLPVKAMWKRLAIGLLIGAVSFVLVFVSFGWVTDGVTGLSHLMTAYAESQEPPVVADRDLFNDLTTMTGRTYVYEGMMRLLQEQPEVLLTGILNSRLVRVVEQYGNAPHAHSSFLQTLLNMGIPGLLMAVWFAGRAVWASVRLIFSGKAAAGDQLLGVALLAFLVGAIPESYLFTEYLTLANMPFFLILGYVLEAERGLRESGINRSV